jgi:hypothetical protein
MSHAAARIEALALADYNLGVWRLRRQTDPSTSAIFTTPTPAVASLVAMLTQPELDSRPGRFGVVGVIGAASIARPAAAQEQHPSRAATTSGERGTRLHFKPLQA